MSAMNPLFQRFESLEGATGLQTSTSGCGCHPPSQSNALIELQTEENPSFDTLQSETPQSEMKVAHKPRRLNPLPNQAENLSEPKSLGRFPAWLHHTLPKGQALLQTHQTLASHRLPTVCEEARCPNLVECYSKKTATFLTMGHQCTRRCGFCSIEHRSQPDPLDIDEPKRLAQAAKELGLRHIVLTQVARDDLLDGGASHLVSIVKQLRQEIANCTLELLTSDFQGNEESLRLVMEAEPEVFNHNLETVRSLSPRVRHKASYERTLELLKRAKSLSRGKTRFIKSGLMVGLGESDEEVYQTLLDLKEHGVDIVTIGQYLQSSRSGLLVRRFVKPETFELYRTWGTEIGIPHLLSAPFVRSSYNAELFIEGGA